MIDTGAGPAMHATEARRSRFEAHAAPGASADAAMAFIELVELLPTGSRCCARGCAM